MGAQSAEAARLLPRQKPGLPEWTLLGRLVGRPWEFEFFEAVHLLRLFQDDVVDPGTQGPLGRESVRFRVRNHLGFAASQIQGIDAAVPASPDDGEAAAGAPVMEVNFLGLQGPSGVLPEHYTILIQRVERDKDNPERGAFRAWLDVFNHRLISYFYRTWAKYRPSVALVTDYCRRPGGFDQPTEAMMSLVGKGLLPSRGVVGRPPDDDPVHQRQRPGCPPLPPFEDRFLIIHGASLARRVRTAGGLASMLSDYLGFPVAVESFSPRWIPLDPENQTCLSRSAALEGARQGVGGLGTGATLGRRALDLQGHVSVRIGPLDSTTFRQFLPAEQLGGQPVDTPLHRIVLDLVRLYLPAGLGFNLRLELAGPSVPEPVLGGDTPVLGRSIWLSKDKRRNSVDDVVLPGA